MSASLLVVAGEASGDRAAAAVLRELDVAAFGLGGPACAAAGLESVGTPAFGAAGFVDVVARAAAVARSFAAVRAAAIARRPLAALLVDYTEFNALLAPRLRALGTKVLWYGAPQVWAWRPSRLRTLPSRIDAMAVQLPFEEALWREAGVDAEYVGHPSVAPSTSTESRATLRESSSLSGTRALALLPGSRPSEVRALLAPMLDAAVRLRRELLDVAPRLVLARSLPEAEPRWAERLATDAGIPAIAAPEDGAAALLPAFDATLCASGTASLEAALAGAPPVVCYRTDRLTAAVVGALLRTPYVALPNVILRRPEWPELLQADATGPKMAAAVRKVLEQRARFDDAARELRECLGEERRPASLVAARIRRWIAPPSPPPPSPRPPHGRSSTTSSSP